MKQAKNVVGAKMPEADATWHFNLNIIVFREAGAYIAYCPSLDISTSGENYNEAISAFFEMFQLHIECCIEMGTLQENLLEHGWKISKTGVTPPSPRELLVQPKMEKFLDGSINYESLNLPTRIPVFT